MQFIVVVVIVIIVVIIVVVVVVVVAVVVAVVAAISLSVVCQDGRLNRNMLARKSVLSFYGTAGLFAAEAKSMLITPQALIQGRANLNRPARPRSVSLALNNNSFRPTYLKNEFLGIRHYKFPPLQANARVGFSLHNLVSQ